MPELPRMTAKEADRILLQNGFLIDRQKGSHRIYKKILTGWLFLITAGKFCTLKSSSNFLRLLKWQRIRMPKRNIIDTITLGLFGDENVSVLCENTLKLERESVAVLSGNSEVGKSFLALKICANAINDGVNYDLLLEEMLFLTKEYESYDVFYKIPIKQINEQKRQKAWVLIFTKVISVMK